MLDLDYYKQQHVEPREDVRDELAELRRKCNARDVVAAIKSELANVVDALELWTETAGATVYVRLEYAKNRDPIWHVVIYNPGDALKRTDVENAITKALDGFPVHSFTLDINTN
jgi:hypothetical protein